MLTVTLKWAHTKCLFKTFLEPAPRENAFFIFCIAENEENLKKIDFFFVQVKNQIKKYIIHF